MKLCPLQFLVFKNALKAGALRVNYGLRANSDPVEGSIRPVTYFIMPYSLNVLFLNKKIIMGSLQNFSF